jgi:hypothetical protein
LLSYERGHTNERTDKLRHQLILFTCWGFCLCWNGITNTCIRFFHIWWYWYRKTSAFGIGQNSANCTEVMI